MLHVYPYRSVWELEKHDYFLILIILSKNLFGMGFNVFCVKYFLFTSLIDWKFVTDMYILSQSFFK